MVKISISRALRKFFTLTFTSLLASLMVGVMATLAATGPILNVRVFPLGNGGVPITAGGAVTYFYQVSNSGDAPLYDIDIYDNKCTHVYYDAVGQNKNWPVQKLDPGAVWSYYCVISANATTTNRVTVNAKTEDGTAVTSVTTATFQVTADPNAPAGTEGSTGISPDGTTPGSGSLNFITPAGMPNTGLGGKERSQKHEGVETSKREVSEKRTSANSDNKEIGIPKKLEIPSLGINAKIKAKGLTRDKKMQAPSNSGHVAWYRHGARPGETGNAVLAGHLDTATSAEGVFANLKDIKVGADVYVTDSKNNSLHFTVTKIAAYTSQDAPLSEIFGASDTPRLNLITCDGKWDRKKHQYQKRLVVYSTLVK